MTNEDSNYVMCSYTGEIDACNMTEDMLVEEGDLLFTVKTTDYDVQIEQLELSRESYETQIAQLERLVESIKNDTNEFDASDPDDELYYSTYEAYKAQVAQYDLDTSTYASYGYTDEQIEAEILKNQGKISEIYYTAIQTAENSIVEAEAQIDSIDAQVSALESGQDEYVVRATASGVLHLLGNYKSGMVLQTTTTVATITPQNSEAVIEAYVSTSDMARMHEGDSVQIVIDGLAQNVYGTISGKVKQIDSNVTTQESDDESASQVFRVLISMDSNYLVSRSGDKVSVTNGMTAVARVQYDKISYFNYVLEKLGFKTR
ncbi:MAG: HlyD family secretion protein [Lachnospiraceae bacterium]|nr:HlyD family secretion protein [Lachnospiraceae bacterium]